MALSRRGDRSGELCTKLQASAMNPRADGVGRELTCVGNLYVAQAARLAHQKDVPRLVIESRQRLIDNCRRVRCADSLMAQRINGQRLSLSVLLPTVVVDD